MALKHVTGTAMHYGCGCIADDGRLIKHCDKHPVPQEDVPAWFGVACFLVPFLIGVILGFVLGG